MNDLIDWMRRERGKLSRHNEVAKAMNYILKRIDVSTRFLEDGRICLSNNAAERRCAASLSDANHGYSQARIVVASALRSC